MVSDIVKLFRYILKNEAGVVHQIRTCSETLKPSPGDSERPVAHSLARFVFWTGDGGYLAPAVKRQMHRFPRIRRVANRNNGLSIWFLNI